MEKGTCDLCGKAVGTAALYRRIGFTPGSRANTVCHACFTGKLHRDERLRFAKPARKRAKAAAGDEDAPARGGPPEELRF